jgi:preprotein translocase subunit SecA
MYSSRININLFGDTRVWAKYPERRDSSPGGFSKKIDRIGGHIQGFFLNFTCTSKRSLQKIALEITRRGDALTLLNKSDLDALTLKLRRDLHRHVHKNESINDLSLQAFALIRQVAERTLKLRHYDSQLMAGWVMLQGQVAEMETGEGKTLAATLAAATMGLSNIPVHIITVNEYLVKRDAMAMAPLYRALGLSVGYVTQEMTPGQKKQGYACDILYCTNKQIVFDYLRDRLIICKNPSLLSMELESAKGKESRLNQLLLRGLGFAILDEADSLLIDEAITPLILTRNRDGKKENFFHDEILELARSFEENVDFFIPRGESRIELTRSGNCRLTEFLCFNKGLKIGKSQGREMICHALHALYLLHRDKDYLIQDDKICIIDANTGRTMADRSWEKGLHQFVEAKEGCSLTGTREQLGRLTYQRFFGRYLRLSGMTGTAKEVSSELGSVYELAVSQIPLHRPSQRKELPVTICSGQKEKWARVIGLVEKLQTRRRPVLIGTQSLADSEILSEKLSSANIDHQVLNARQDRGEADIIARAGQKGEVTVATNMAGRGTDIALGDGVAELGGLHVIATCRNLAQRIDRQLSGRCARQGDPGSFQAVLSLEDELIVRNCHPKLVRFLINSTQKKRILINKLNFYLVKHAQKLVEKRYCRARKALLAQDRQIARLLGFSGHME